MKRLLFILVPIILLYGCGAKDNTNQQSIEESQKQINELQAQINDLQRQLDSREESSKESIGGVENKEDTQIVENKDDIEEKEVTIQTWLENAHFSDKVIYKDDDISIVFNRIECDLEKEDGSVRFIVDISNTNPQNTKLYVDASQALSGDSIGHHSFIAINGIATMSKQIRPSRAPVEGGKTEEIRYSFSEKAIYELLDDLNIDISSTPLQSLAFSVAVRTGSGPEGEYESNIYRKELKTDEFDQQIFDSLYGELVKTTEYNGHNVYTYFNSTKEDYYFYLFSDSLEPLVEDNPSLRANGKFVNFVSKQNATRDNLTNIGGVAIHFDTSLDEIRSKCEIPNDELVTLSYGGVDIFSFMDPPIGGMSLSLESQGKADDTTAEGSDDEIIKAIKKYLKTKNLDIDAEASMSLECWEDNGVIKFEVWTANSDGDHPMCWGHGEVSIRDLTGEYNDKIYDQKETVDYSKYK